MSHNNKDEADITVLKETIDYFKKLGFSESYVDEIERDLLNFERKINDILKSDRHND